MRDFFALDYRKPGLSGNVRVNYFTGGMMMPGRNTEYSWSRMGYNGQAKDDEVYGKGNLNSAKFWEYDTRINFRWNTDPITVPSLSPYAVFNGNPISNSDIHGDAPSSWVHKMLKFFGLAPQVSRSEDLSPQERGEEQNKFVERREIYDRTTKDVTEKMGNVAEGMKYIPFLNSAVNSAQGNHKTAGVFLIVDMFGGSLIKPVAKFVSPITGGLMLKGAGKFGMCREFASDFMVKIAKSIEAAGAKVIKYEINIPNAAGIATTKAPISQTGLHQFVEVIKDGKSVIFDNVHTKGIAKEEFIKEIGAMTKQGKVYEGAEIFEKFVKPVK